MRGEVLYYDEAQGFGFIHGADDNRYTFAAEDLRRAMPVDKGMTVEFQPSGDKAHAIFSIRTSEPASAATVSARPEPASTHPVAPAPARFGRFAAAGQASPCSTGLWAYFRRGLSENYVAFGGRARRKEYWGYFLFWMLALLAVCFLGLIVDGAVGNLDSRDGPILTAVAAGLFMLATVLPGLAVTVRRIHDIGLSGWFWLLIFIPYAGGLIILVFSLIPGQKNDNKWGPVPEGVRA